MTTILQVKFPWGKYHATEWGRNVNEGRPEWPPAPWRLLRALFSTWKTRCTHLETEHVEAALRQISEPPTLHVPAMKAAHLRHYMPQASYRSVEKKPTTLTFDSFAVLDAQTPVFIEWDVDMTAGPTAALAEIAASLSYLGRAESVCDAELVSQVGDYPGLVSWQPATREDPVDAEVLCASSSFELSDLCQTTDIIKKDRRLFPHGSIKVPYVKSKTAQATTPESATRVSKAGSAVRLTVHHRPQPVAANAVVVGELLRRAALKKHSEPSEMLSGKRLSGDHIREKHQHAHYLSLTRKYQANAADAVSSLVVWTPGQLENSELTALARIRWLRAGRAASNVPNLAVAVSAFGDIKDVAPELVGPSSFWQSFTPFVPGRHNRKLPWDEHIRIEIERELTVYRDLPVPASVEVLEVDTRRYRRYRLPPKETMSDNRRAAMVQIRFEKPVEGPIALGALSHFGLGLFLPYSLSAG